MLPTGSVRRPIDRQVRPSPIARRLARRTRAILTEPPRPRQILAMSPSNPPANISNVPLESPSMSPSNPLTTGTGDDSKGNRDGGGKKDGGSDGGGRSPFAPGSGGNGPKIQSPDNGPPKTGLPGNPVKPTSRTWYYYKDGEWKTGEGNLPRWTWGYSKVLQKNGKPIQVYWDPRNDGAAPTSSPGNVGDEIGNPDTGKVYTGSHKPTMKDVPLAPPQSPPDFP